MHGCCSFCTWLLLSSVGSSFILMGSRIGVVISMVLSFFEGDSVTSFIELVAAWMDSVAFAVACMRYLRMLCFAGVGGYSGRRGLTVASSIRSGISAGDPYAKRRRVNTTSPSMVGNGTHLASLYRRALF